MEGSQTKEKYKKKKGIKFTQEMLIQRIASETSSTQPQVKEVLNVLFETVEELLLRPDCPQFFELKMGNIGKLEQKPRTGRKVGIYKRPNNFGHDIIEEMVTEEEPSYQMLEFTMSPSFKEKIKKASKNRARTQKWSTCKIVGVDKNGKEIVETTNYTGWKARAGKYYPLDAEV